MHLLDGVDQIRQAFQCVVLALHRNDDAVGSAQPVQGQHGEAGRAVDEDEVVFILHRRECVLEALLAVFQLDQINLGTGQFAVGGEQIVAGNIGAHPRGGHILMPDQHLVHGMGHRTLVYARAHGGIALGIEVDQQHALLKQGECGGKVDGAGGFSDATLLVGDCEDAGHGQFRVRMRRCLSAATPGTSRR